MAVALKRGIVGPMHKTCSKCQESKPATAEFFTRRKDSKVGWTSRCKSCIAAAGRARWSDPDYHAKALAGRAVKYADPAFQEKERLRQQKRKADPVHIAAEVSRQKRRAADPDHQRKEVERGQRRREDETYRAKVSAFGKKWYAANTARHNDAARSWYDSNRDAVRAKRSSPSSRARTNNWTRSHHRKHPHLKVLRSVGSAISEILKEGRVSGGFRFLPYSRNELCVHLERQFLSGMSWSNYGAVWHVDHILPQSRFQIDATDPVNCSEFQACWALTNLRPLWKRDNLSKNDRRLHLL
jgi:hypothetical protein